MDAGVVAVQSDVTPLEVEQLAAPRSGVRGETEEGEQSVVLELAKGAKESIDLLAYAGSFLHDSIPGFFDHVAERSDKGVRVRLLFGDPTSDAVALRGREEEIDDLMAARCRLTWKYLGPCVKAHRMQARQHGTTLYASIFRFDDVLLANPHAYGASASQSPVLHINRIPGGRLFSHYMDSYDRVWATARPL